MKKLILTAIGFLFFANISITQNWTITTKSGLGIKALTPSGQLLDVKAFLDEGDDCFMDVKAIQGQKSYPVKLTLSNKLYIPVAAITEGGTTYPIIAIDKNGAELEVNGVSRFGNTIKIAAIAAGEDFIDIIATSDDGRVKDVAGVKFLDENVETSINNTDIIAHVKALPQTNVRTTERAWKIAAKSFNGDEYEVVALNKNGKEYPVKALSSGGSYMIMNVKAITGREEANVKLTQTDKGIFLTAIDQYGREFPVMVKKAEGEYVKIEAGVNCGKTIDIMAEAKDGMGFAIHAISPENDVYDVKGIKILDRPNEGVIQGLKGLVPYYGHVKALPPVNLAEDN